MLVTVYTCYVHCICYDRLLTTCIKTDRYQYPSVNIIKRWYYFFSTEQLKNTLVLSWKRWSERISFSYLQTFRKAFPSLSPSGNWYFFSCCLLKEKCIFFKSMRRLRTSYKESNPLCKFSSFQNASDADQSNNYQRSINVFTVSGRENLMKKKRGKGPQERCQCLCTHALLPLLFGVWKKDDL